MPFPDSPSVTYSPAVTLVPTYECFNRCTYCNFRRDLGAHGWLSLEEARRQLAAARSHNVIEVLVLSGEVHFNSVWRTQWLQRIYDICALALQMGFLPHTNVGPLREAEMALLKHVNVSMGLMVEQVTPNLLQGVHRYAPSKVPAVRLQQLEQAGQLGIPFTTGLLLGIGESENDRIETLKAIAGCYDRWGHIQEVILQPHQPGTQQAELFPSFTADQLVDFVIVARRHLPAEITIQIPPNLVGSDVGILRAIANGAYDLGGLGPLDEVNPGFPHPTPEQLATLLATQGWTLQTRLPVYPQYDTWLPEPLQNAVRFWRQRLSIARTRVAALPLSTPNQAGVPKADQRYESNKVDSPEA